METEVDDFLAHYGVKGMKWGFRKNKVAKSKKSKKTKSKKTRRPMSNEDKLRVAQVTAGAALLALRYGPGMVNLGRAGAWTVAAQQNVKNAAKSEAGRNAAASALKAIGSHKTTAMKQGADGIWRLMAPGVG